MKMPYRLMIGAALVVIVVTMGAVGWPLAALLLVGLLLLCPLMILGLHGGGREQGGGRPPAGPDLRESPRQGVRRDGR